MQAANILLDRGWGKPPQPHTGEDGKDIRVVIRHIVEGFDGKLIDAVPIMARS